MYFMGFSKWLLLSSRLVAGELVILRMVVSNFKYKRNKSDNCVHTQPFYPRDCHGDLAVCVACLFAQHRKVSYWLEIRRVHLSSVFTSKTSLVAIINDTYFSLIARPLEPSPVCLLCRHWHGGGLVHLRLPDQKHCPQGPGHCVCCCDGVSTSRPSDWSVLCCFLMANPSSKPPMCGYCKTRHKTCPCEVLSHYCPLVAKQEEIF